MRFETRYGATPLDQSEVDGLIPSQITTMYELNAFEHANILMAEQWASGSRFSLTVPYIKKLHQHMFNKTWQWAGCYRTTGKNIGVDAYRIETDLKQLCDDVLFQIDNKSYEFDEIAIRFIHRLVCIHPFPNGNGRHSRLMADLLLMKHKRERFIWGSSLKESDDDIRKAYIEALIKANNYDIGDLLRFARS